MLITTARARPHPRSLEAHSHLALNFQLSFPWAVLHLPEILKSSPLAREDKGQILSLPTEALLQHLGEPVLSGSALLVSLNPQLGPRKQP